MNSTNSVLNSTDYYPYGKATSHRSNYGTNYEGYRYQYTGHEKDGETSYQYHGARYYDEDLARYMSVDRYAMKFFHQSPYVYAGNMPINAVDHNGDSVLFYSESGKYLGYSNDNQRYKDQNLLTIISDKEVSNFRTRYDFKRSKEYREQKGLNDNQVESHVAGLEAMGQSFNVTSFVKFYDQYKDKKEVNGKIVPLEGDEKDIGVEWTIGLKIDKSNSLDKNGSIAIDNSKEPYTENNKSSVTITINASGIGGFHSHALFGNPSPSKDPDHKNADQKQRGAWQIVQGNGLFSLYRDNFPYDYSKSQIVEIPIRTTGQFTKNQIGM